MLTREESVGSIASAHDVGRGCSHFNATARRPRRSAQSGAPATPRLTSAVANEPADLHERELADRPVQRQIDSVCVDTPTSSAACSSVNSSLGLVTRKLPRNS